MNLTNPVRSVAPTVDADVLAVLARNHTPLSGLQIQKLAGRSYDRVRAVLERLVVDGVAHVDRHGNTNAYRLNRSHVLADAIVALAAALWSVEDHAQQLVVQLLPKPLVVALFGSFARRDGNSASDIDMIIVRGESVQGDDLAWRRQVDHVASELELKSGNHVQVVELSVAEMESAIAEDQPLITSLRRDGVVLTGSAPWQTAKRSVRKR
jgi:predicted nucleotidyltransferase